jgi:Na+-driven multidrug efflux pump
MMYYAWIGVVSNVIFNAILIPLYGINGAALAMVISQFIIAVVANLLSPKTRKALLFQMQSLNLFRVVKNSLIMLRH